MQDIAAQRADAVAPVFVWPEPEWIRAAAEDRGWLWARKAWARAAAVEGAWFDAAKTDSVVAIWPHWMRLTSGIHAGYPFKLLQWQEIIVRLLVGWKRPIEAYDPATGADFLHVRLFRSLKLWMPRKNGKTEFLAALGKLFFAHERIVGAQGYCFAKDLDQASVVFDKIKAMIEYDPTLRGGNYQATKGDIYFPETRAVMQRLTGNAEGKHGREPTVIVGDEMHEWESRALADTLRDGCVSRPQWIELHASTAGLRDNSVGADLYAESRDILDGAIDDPFTLVAIFALDEGDDVFDEANWPRANPSLGHALLIDALRQQVARAKGNPRKTAWLKCYHFGLWIDSVSAWLPRAEWAACSGDGRWKDRWTDLKGRRCLLALDLAARRDIVALIGRFDPLPGEAGPKIACRFWIPEDTLRRRAEEDKRTPWEYWRDIGAIETTPGAKIDQNVMMRAIAQARADYDHRETGWIGFDDWQAEKITGDLQLIGVAPDEMVMIRMGTKTLGAPTETFEGQVFAGELDHGGHPVLAWMAKNAVARFDENLNFVPAKKRSKDKIDGIVGIVMAEALAMHQVDEPPRVY